MSEWGVTSTGYQRPRLDALRTELEARYKARFGENRNTDHDTPDGMIIDWAAEAFALFLETDEAAWNASFFDGAADVSLDLWMADRGFIRRDATRSTVEIALGGTPSTVILAGSRIRLPDSGETFTLDANATIGGGGTVDAMFTATNAGPVVALADSDWVIETLVAGWETAENSLDANVGRAREKDPEFKARYMAAIRHGGLGFELLKRPGVEDVTIFENDTDIPDGLYDATHWVEALIVGGEDQDLFDTIWRHKPKGIGTQGDTGGTESVSGSANAVRLTRGTATNVYVTATITAGEGFPEDVATATAIRNGIVAWGNANHSHGDDVAPDLIRAQIAALASGRFSADVRVGTVPSPSGTAMLGINPRNFARFDTSRTTVTIV